MPDGISQVATDIYQIRLPLPFELRIVNCYILKDGNGWTIIDTGLNYPPSYEMWNMTFAELGVQPGTLKRVILTHAHPDHYGMAGWFAETYDIPIFLSSLEQYFAQHAWIDSTYTDDAFITFFSQHGLPDDLGKQVQQDMAGLRAMIKTAENVTLLEPDARIKIGQRDFQTHVSRGHSDGHLVFHCAEERLLICGDAVLSKITPNIGIWPLSRENPLDDFLQSLDHLATLPVDLALTGHGPIITAFADRLTELHIHHRERLRLLEEGITQQTNAFEAAHVLFDVERLSSHQKRFALAETLAHLEYLARLDRLERIEQHEHIWYRRAA